MSISEIKDKSLASVNSETKKKFQIGQSQDNVRLDPIGDENHILNRSLNGLDFSNVVAALNQQNDENNQRENASQNAGDMSARSSNSRTSRSLNRSIRNYRHIEAHVSINSNNNPFQS